MQEKLLKKLGANAYPFFFELPPASPTSVTLQANPMETGKPLGVEYDLRTWIGENKEEKPHRRSSVSMAIRKVCHLCSTLLLLLYIN
jgi:beta-arrestin